MFSRIIYNLRYWLRNMMLFQKMLFFYIILLCIPTVVISGFFVGSLARSLQRQYVQGKENMLWQAKETIENMIAQVEYCRNSFQYNQALLEYVNGHDFTDGIGAEMWLQYVKPAFEQVSVANKGFSRICVWRVRPMSKNDPRYVLNAKDNKELYGKVPVKYNDKMLLFERNGQDTKCRIYQALFDINGFHKIGYLEVECEFDWLFSALHFIEEGEILQVSCEQGDYVVKETKDGHLYLEKAKKDRIKMPNQSTERMDGLAFRMDYYYPDLSVWSNWMVILVLGGICILFSLSSCLYYVIYLSMTKRMIMFSKHMQYASEERIEPFLTEDSKDEIGLLIRSYNRMAERINTLNGEILQKVTLANHARYYAMQSQIQPHFLYNTLENIDMLIELGENEKASRMMNLFSKILRYNLSYERKLTTIENEIRHAEDYLKLYSFRMQDDFSYTVEMEPTCARISCPYCMLQPVVENCFKHGFRDQERSLWVHVRAWCENGFVWIDVEDNGEGISAERLSEIKKSLELKEMPEEEVMDGKEKVHVGLNNVNERIQLLCGKGSGLWVEQREQGCLVKIAINMYAKGMEKNVNENSDRG